MAAAALRHTTGSRKALDPLGRDQLLRRLAVVDPEEACVEFILTALEGYPIREGARIVAEFAADRGLRPEVRSRAADVLATAADRAIAERLVSAIADEQSREVTDALLKLAVQRSLPVPLRWMERKIQLCRSPVQLHRLLKTLVQILPFGDGAEPNDACDIFHRLIAKAMKDDGDNESDLPKGLVKALSLTGSQRALASVRGVSTSRPRYFGTICGSVWKDT